MRRAVALAPGDLVPQSLLGWGAGYTGGQPEAVAILADLERRRRDAYVGGLLLAWVNLGLRDYDQAISLLQRAAEERDGFMDFLST